MEILAGANRLAWIYERSYAALSHQGRLRERCDVSEKLVSAFGELLATVDKDPDSHRGSIKLGEGGLLLHPSFRQFGEAVSYAGSESGSLEGLCAMLPCWVLHPKIVRNTLEMYIPKERSSPTPSALFAFNSCR